MSNTPMLESRFCPKCGSPAVDFSSLEGGEASCRSCSWKGQKEALLVHKFSGVFSSENDVLVAFSKDVRDLMKEMGPKFIAILLRWGFIGKAEPGIVLPYFRSASVAIAEAVLRTRNEISKEKKHE